MPSAEYNILEDALIDDSLEKGTSGMRIT